MTNKRIPTKEQLQTCKSIKEVRERFYIGYRKTKRLMREYGIDFGIAWTLERQLENEKIRNRLAMTIRRLKAKGMSDQKVAEHLKISRWNVQQARRQFEIGHTHG